MGITVWRRGGSPWDRWFRPRAATDAKGEILFSDLLPGAVLVDAMEEATRHVDLRAGERAVLNFPVERYARVRGRVVDPEGRPVPGAEIWESECGKHTVGTVVATADEHGAFAIEAGISRYFGARKDGYAPSDLLSPVPYEGGEAEIELVLGGPGARISGTVIDARGTPIAGALVLVGEERGQPIRQPDGRQTMEPPAQALRADADGRFMSGSLRVTDTVPVQAIAESYGPVTKRVAVASGETSEVRLTLEREAIVTGVVRDAAGAPIDGAWIVSPDPWQFAGVQCRADGDGAFRIAGLPSGKATLCAEADGHGAIRAELSLVAGQTTVWEPRLAEVYRIAGRIVDERGAGMPEVFVEAEGYDASRSDRQVGEKTDADGAFDLRVPHAGSYEVRVGSHGGFPWGSHGPC